jgi:hypothetical protein
MDDLPHFIGEILIIFNTFSDQFIDSIEQIIGIFT